MVPEIFLNSSPPKSNIYERGWNSFDQGNFILDSLAVDWVDITISEKKNRFLIWLFFEIQFNALWISSIKKANQTEIEIQNQALDYTWLTKINFKALMLVAHWESKLSSVNDTGRD